MKKTFLIISLILGCVAYSALFVNLAFAQYSQNNPSTVGVSQNNPPISNSSSGCTSGQICNPLLNVNSIQDLIAAVLKFVVNLLAIAGVVYIMWTGLMFVKAQGNPGELEKAKTSFLHAIIGMAIILGAWAIATAIANTINQLTNNKNTSLTLPQ